MRATPSSLACVTVLACVAMSLSAADAHAARGDRDGSRRCKSDDFDYRHCDLDTRGGVELVHQHSKTRCVRGRNWGWDRDGVWVDDGCDAEFRSGARGGWEHGGRGDGARTFRCKSYDFDYNHCDADVRGARVELVRQRSKTDCRQGRNWGVDRGGIWVDEGCDAEFRVAGGRRGR
ncbi:DUF3011 domain-containing protein [Coralloluteibacterium stylophorae]|uniref:DUF3011 domain-containing protein n=1 Tax=Coralloluteibacterium stylophorae TaxID=1776034 RepID=A0A8J7VWT1_9GAMM|nr:DUF3011 domain-containing protein [Coralloluteibacterium stylophorae]MBS7457527.1 DUF3011 domain-containing protein [Coralloluteibacterium stylophorae]